MKTSRWFAFLLASTLVLGLLPFSTTNAPWGGSFFAPRPAQAQLGYKFQSLFYIKRVAWLCNEHYVERQQIRPTKMFRKALERIQLLVPAILVRFPKKGKSRRGSGQPKIPILSDQGTKNDFRYRRSSQGDFCVYRSQLQRRGEAPQDRICCDSWNFADLGSAHDLPASFLLQRHAHPYRWKIRWLGHRHPKS